MSNDIDVISSKKLALICIDESKNSEDAFYYYMKHIHQPDDDIGLVHIHTTPTLTPLGDFSNLPLIEFGLYEVRLKESIEMSKKIMEKYSRICKRHQITAKEYLLTKHDSVGHSICKLAHDELAYLIVIGQRGIGSLRRTIHGSVSHYVLRHSKIPVTVVPSTGK